MDGGMDPCFATAIHNPSMDPSIYISCHQSMDPSIQPLSMDEAIHPFVLPSIRSWMHLSSLPFIWSIHRSIHPPTHHPGMHPAIHNPSMILSIDPFCHPCIDGSNRPSSCHHGSIHPAFHPWVHSSSNLFRYQAIDPSILPSINHPWVHPYVICVICAILSYLIHTS